MTYGFSLLNELLNPTENNKNLNNPFFNNLFRAVRIVSIVLDETHPRFKELGEWNSLGCIEYSSVINPSSTGPFPIAVPLLSNNKKFPLVNEIVYLLYLPNKRIGTITSNSINYYLDIVSIWNHPHHNAFPVNSNDLLRSQNKDYKKTQQGAVKRIKNKPTEIFLGKTFKERTNIHPLLPFEGDILYEGRWGNSIRLGSTVPNMSNNWSVVGTAGDPIIILRNGQGIQTEEGWIPIVENINNDDSSIYVTSTQQIPIEASSVNYLSYKNNPPQSPSQYSNKQIILNSGRLTFNSTSDHILLSSKKSINLNAVENCNVDSPTMTIQANKIYLGSKNAVEPLLLGNRTIDALNNIINNLNAFLQICSVLVSTPPGTPLVPLNIAADGLSQQLNSIQSNLEKLKSNSTYTV
jgi:hypothetical protein